MVKRILFVSAALTVAALPASPVRLFGDFARLTQVFGNLLNKNWGVSQRMVHTQPLIFRSVNGASEPVYRFRNVGDQLMSRTFEPTAGTGDVYRIQLQVRYNFN